eukprot:gene5306-7370_t
MSKGINESGEWTSNSVRMFGNKSGASVTKLGNRDLDNHFGDGYISDVPTQHSNGSNSDVSYDFINSTKVLERHFRDKYQVLKSAYERRISQFSQTVEQVFEKILNDDILHEMRGDATSLQYIPSHIAEIVTDHLNGEREKYVQLLIQKSSGFEFEYTKEKDINIFLKRKLENQEKQIIQGNKAQDSLVILSKKLLDLEQQYNTTTSENDEEIQQLKTLNHKLKVNENALKSKLEKSIQEIVDKTNDNDALQKLIAEKNHQKEILENINEQITRELNVFENSEKQETQIKRELNDKIRVLSDERNQLQQELILLKTKNEYLIGELKRSAEYQDKKSEEEKLNKDKMESVMMQLEQVLQQEANESNQAILSVHEKMKEFRGKMLAELQKEKRFSTTLQDELNKMKSLRDGHDQEQCSLLRIQIQEVTSHLTEHQLRNMEATANIKQLTDKIYQLEKSHPYEISLKEERIRVELKKEYDEEKNNIESKSVAIKLQLQNEIENLKQKISQLLSNESSSHVSSEIMKEKLRLASIAASDQIQMKQEIIETKEKQLLQQEQLWTSEKQSLQEQLSLVISKNHDQLSLLQENFSKLSYDYESEIQMLKSRLFEASHHLDNLKNVIQDHKVTIENQNNVISKLSSMLQIQHPSIHNNYHNTSASLGQTEESNVNNNDNNNNIDNINFVNSHVFETAFSPTSTLPLYLTNTVLDAAVDEVRISQKRIIELEKELSGMKTQVSLNNARNDAKMQQLIVTNNDLKNAIQELENKNEILRNESMKAMGEANANNFNQ